MTNREELAGRLGDNVRRLREARGLSQAEIAKGAGVPRATWANVESGLGNPTLAVLFAVAAALAVTVEELVAPPRASARVYPKDALPTRTSGQALIRKLLPDPIRGMEIERIELGARGRMTGVPHTEGTREYLTCESGRIVVVVGGERFEVGPGDVVVFRGDQRHSYVNPEARIAVGYSVVVLVSR